MNWIHCEADGGQCPLIRNKLNSLQIVNCSDKMTIHPFVYDSHTTTLSEVFLRNFPRNLLLKNIESNLFTIRYIVICK